MITCHFSECTHNNGEGDCDTCPDLSLYCDNYHMLFTCSEMDLSKEADENEEDS